MTRRHRFTLMEVLIATAIFIGLAFVLFVYAGQTTQSWSKIQTRRNHLSELLTIDRAIDNILPNVIPFLWPDPDEDSIVETPFIIAEENYLRCAYLHRLNDAQEGAIRFAEIKVDDDGHLIISYTDRPFLNWDDVQDAIQTSTLASNIESVTFSYADFSDDDTLDWSERLFWSTEWETEDSERKDAPLAIMMTLTWKDGSTETWLRRTMGNSYRERYGKWEAQDTTN